MPTKFYIYAVSKLFFLLISDEFSSLSNTCFVLRIIFPLVFAYIKGDNQYTSCIWINTGFIFWLFLFWTTSNPYCWFTCSMLHYYTYTKSTNRSTVMFNKKKCFFFSSFCLFHSFVVHLIKFDFESLFYIFLRSFPIIDFITYLFVFFFSKCLLLQSGYDCFFNLLVIGAFASYLLRLWIIYIRYNWTIDGDYTKSYNAYIQHTRWTYAQ